ncbi:MAG: M56 family metallopeptidase [Planctomycetia bacterium]|nr:M56 family metallopeptidase [Planctomycetia bacterium]
MQNFLTILFITSVSMSLLVFLMMVFSPFFTRKCSPRWQYGAWLVIALGFLVPFRPQCEIGLIPLPISSVSQELSTSITDHFSRDSKFADSKSVLSEEKTSFSEVKTSLSDENIHFDKNSLFNESTSSFQEFSDKNEGRTCSVSLPLTPSMTQASPSFPLHPEENALAKDDTLKEKTFFYHVVQKCIKIFSGLSFSQFLFGFWFMGITSISIWHIWRYYRFIKMVKRWSTEVTEEKTHSLFVNILSEMKIRQQVKLKTCYGVSSPMMYGFISPVILLPEMDIPADELDFILRHELTHLKRKDLWWKTAVLAATILHWFNPIVYIMARQVAEKCETSCDAEVIKNTNLSRRQQYAEAIIGVIRNRGRVQTVLTTSFYSGKRGMKNRIFTIMDTRQKATGAAAFLGVITITLCTGFLFATVIPMTEIHAPLPVNEISNLLSDNLSENTSENTSEIKVTSESKTEEEIKSISEEEIPENTPQDTLSDRLFSPEPFPQESSFEECPAVPLTKEPAEISRQILEYQNSHTHSPQIQVQIQEMMLHLPQEEIPPYCVQQEPLSISPSFTVRIPVNPMWDGGRREKEAEKFRTLPDGQRILDETRVREIIFSRVPDNHYGITILRMTLTHEAQGTFYKGTFQKDENTWQFSLDAINGEILEWKEMNLSSGT